MTGPGLAPVVYVTLPMFPSPGAAALLLSRGCRRLGWRIGSAELVEQRDEAANRVRAEVGAPCHAQFELWCGRREGAVGDPAGGEDARGLLGDNRAAEPGCHGGVGALQRRRLQ